METNQELEKNLNESKQSDDYFLNLVRFLQHDNNQEYQQMKRITLIFIALSVSIFTKNVNAQSNHIPNKCSTVEVAEQEMQKHPELKSERAKYEKSVQ